MPMCIPAGAVLAKVIPVLPLRCWYMQKQLRLIGILAVILVLGGSLVYLRVISSSEMMPQKEPLGVGPSRWEVRDGVAHTRTSYFSASVRLDDRQVTVTFQLPQGSLRYIYSASNPVLRQTKSDVITLDLGSGTGMIIAVSERSLKETYVLSNVLSPLPEFTLEVDPNLHLAARPDGTYVVSAAGLQVAHFDAPSATDAGGYALPVKLFLFEQRGRIERVDLSAWTKAVYPVQIDPTITVRTVR